jgi:DNA-binding NarL/FixJ family response regulator
MTSIVIVEDETLVRQGLVELLSLDPRFRVVAEAANGDEALRVMSDCLAFPGRRWLRACRRKEFRFPSF